MASVPFTLALYFEDVALSRQAHVQTGVAQSSAAARVTTAAAAALTTALGLAPPSEDARLGDALPDNSAVPARSSTALLEVAARLMQPEALHQVRAGGQRVVHAVVDPLRRMASDAGATSAFSGSTTRRERATVTLVRSDAKQPLGLDLSLEPVTRVPGYRTGPGSASTLVVVRSVAPGSVAAASGQLHVR